ncbi:uncharacterized protein DS421_4g127270 [Arachis hypogaea]|nr:uncharacterized protein DS421_4g127270 [Arachis hypogaea]
MSSRVCLSLKFSLFGICLFCKSMAQNPSNQQGVHRPDPVRRSCLALNTLGTNLV